MNTLQLQLLGSLNEFTAFARGRLADPELAADVVQESLLKAIQASEKGEAVVNAKAWFYRILRRTIIDVYRRRGAQERALARFELELHNPPQEDEEQVVCTCLGHLVPTLKPEYAEVLTLLDLEGQSIAQAAATLSLKENNIKVRLHRARKQLRERLIITCGICATHGCLDCTCSSGTKGGCGHG